MELVLIRHAEAEELDPDAAWGMDDALRPLTEKGRAQAQHAASALAKFWGIADVVASSALTRAQETAAFLVKSLSPSGPNRILSEFAPEGDLTQQLQRLLEFEADSRVAIVGHQPSISALAGQLIGARPTLNFVFKPACICAIEFEGPPRAGRGMLKAFISRKAARAML